MVDITRRKLLSTSAAAALGASVAGVASGDEIEESDTPGAPSVRGSLKRFSTTAFGAEVTGPFVFQDGMLLYSLQHPNQEKNQEPFDRAGVGYFRDFQFQFDGANDDFTELSTPQTDEEQQKVRSGNGDYTMLARGREEIHGGEERLGVTQTPDGTDITMDNFAGTQYGGPATNPDCNQFVPTDDDGTEGYLFTNWENSPGNVSRIPINQTEDGEWEADLDNATNLANTEPLRALGGTRINCYGDRTPWNTMISSEENYAHPRVSLTATVSDVVEAGSGKGLLGAAAFWNRPNPAEAQDAVDQYFGDDSWPIQGFWSLDGVEFLAYYLGSEEGSRGESNPQTPIGDVYPNPYRYGYHVDFREPEADPPQPIKYYVMGRAAWEAPDIQADERTVYGCSDGDSKGIYKFVADEPIPSYEDPMDVAGTLYAPKITNAEANASETGSRESPAQVPLEIEWLPLGHASNDEIESWIAEYDDVTQVDYLEAHAATDWEDDLGTAIEEADRAVVENGNQNYVTNEEIIEWADQYRSQGPCGVDEEVRKIPFLETRAAAKEIGASIEFNKAEGVDSIDGAGPGDFVYFGISEFNDDMANDEGDIQMDRVDGGVVYRGELEPDYNVSTLEPVIVGPDFTDPPEDADDALRNIDNVYVMEDGRVLCCEDGFGGPARSYPNDCLYVYQPNVTVDAESVTVEINGTNGADVLVSSLPSGFSGAEMRISVAEPRVASITGVSFPDLLDDTESSVTDDGSSATITVADTDENVEAGAMNLSLATLEITGDSAGTTEISVEIDQLVDDSGEAIEAEARAGTAVSRPPSNSGKHPSPGGSGHGRGKACNRDDEERGEDEETGENGEEADDHGEDEETAATDEGDGSDN